MISAKVSPDHRHLARQISILIILLLAFAVRVYQLQLVPLNLDEIRTINQYVPLPLAEIFVTLHSNNHALASALAHLFSPQADNLFLLRWPVVLVGILSLPFAYRLGADGFGWKVGLITLFLLSFTPAHMGYSMILRGYVGLISLTTISLFFLARAIRFNGRWAWIGFALTNTVIIHFHLFAVLAVWSQVGLVGLWLLWGRLYKGVLPQEIWKKFSLVVIWLVVTHGPVIYVRTTTILTTEVWPSAFEVWRNGHLALVEEVSPIFRTIYYVAPMTPGGVGFYLYLFFFVLGLVYLWRHQKIWLVGALAWFAAPFGAIWLATQLSPTFYAYERFAFYLLPLFLMLVALGMVTLAHRLLGLAGGRSRSWQITVKAAFIIFVIGLVGLFTVSTGWYRQTTTATDWWGLAQTLLANRQPNDITICEEPHGFDVPDRAKAYCIWMLDFFVPSLTEYTPKFQSSTDFVANYDYLQQNRANLLNPGGVWLVVWRRTVFHPGGLTTDQKPATDPVVLPPGLERYAAVWRFGRAALVYVNSEPTLFDNLFKTVELLSHTAPSSADQARYYRSLAEMEAFRGQKIPAQRFYDQSWAAVEAAGGQYPALFLLDTTPLLDRIPAADLPPESAVQMNQPVGASLCLKGYQLKPQNLGAGQPLDLTLYWQVLDYTPGDYNFFLELTNQAGQSRGRLDFEPFDRTYPTPWWWPNQKLVETHQFVIPSELPFHNYTVQFGAYDRSTPAQEIVFPLFELAPHPQSGEWDAIPAESLGEPHCPD